MESFIFRCAKTKSVLKEDKPMQFFYLRKIKFGSKNNLKMIGKDSSLNAFQY